MKWPDKVGALDHHTFGKQFGLTPADFDLLVRADMVRVKWEYDVDASGTPIKMIRPTYSVYGLERVEDRDVVMARARALLALTQPEERERVCEYCGQSLDSRGVCMDRCKVR